MLVCCPFCKQLLIQAYVHVQFLYAVCFNCFKRIVKKFRIVDFERVSVFKDKGNQQLNKLKQVNQQLRHHLETNIAKVALAMSKHFVDEYFDQINDFRKSHQNTISTSPQLGQQTEENPIKNSKSIPQKLKQPSVKVQQTTTIQKLSIMKDKLTSTGISLIEKIKESERYEQQAQSIANYKDKIIQRSDAVKNKLSKIKSDFREIKSELPSLKETIKGMEIGSMLKSKLFGRW